VALPGPCAAILGLSPNPAPNRGPTLSGMRRGFGLQVVAVALLVIACTAGPSERPSAPATASSAVSPGPTVAVSSTPAPTASASSAAEPLSTVHTTALGQLTGNWLFYGVQIPRPERNRIEIQIVAVPVGGGAAKTVVAFDAAIPTQGIFDNTPYLRRQFSPDGKRMVFSIDGQLVVIDLVTGRATRLGARGFHPSWSTDGSQIAFIVEPSVARHWPVLPAAIGVVPAAGGSPRELVVVGYQGQSVEWSPDGSRFLFPDSYNAADASVIATMEVASGRISRRDEEVSSTPTSFAHWRAASPQLAIASSWCGPRRPWWPRDVGTPFRFVAIDKKSTGSPIRLVVGTPPLSATSECDFELRDPRWNPAVADELLYIEAHGNDSTAAVLNITVRGPCSAIPVCGGTITWLPISAYEATWTSDGSAVAYLLKSPGSSFGSALRVWNRDGSGETELRRANGAIGEAFFSIASVSY